MAAELVVGLVVVVAADAVGSPLAAAAAVAAC